MFNVVLVHPEIPPNTGNVIRLCANTGASLHLIRPLGFSLEDKHMKRAGLDYWEYATLKIHDNWEAFLAAEHPNPERMFAMTTKGSTVFSQLKFMPGDWFISALKAPAFLMTSAARSVHKTVFGCQCVQTTARSTSPMPLQ